MKQSRAGSAIEALTNIAVGLGLSIGLQALVLPLLGVPITLDANLKFAAVMTVVSIARSFVLRRVFEALHVRRPLSPFMAAVIAERFRQIEIEGWHAGHDDCHPTGDLARAGAAYALYARRHLLGDSPKKSSNIFTLALQAWPWAAEWWKPVGFRRDLVKAGALILAEGERFDRTRGAVP